MFIAMLAFFVAFVSLGEVESTGDCTLCNLSEAEFSLPADWQ